jgi:hypothetical protein
MAKNNKVYKIELSEDDIYTMQGFVDGALGTSDCKDFTRFAKRVLKKIEKALKQPKK